MHKLLAAIFVVAGFALPFTYGSAQAKPVTKSQKAKKPVKKKTAKKTQAAQKEEAVAQMIAMTKIAEQEASVETLLLSKGFSEVVVNLTDKSADVVVKHSELTDANLAQIEDIIARKTSIAPENIVITTVKEYSSEE